MRPVVRAVRSLFNVNSFSSELSQVDIIYRELLRNDFFGKGWGDVSRVETLLKFHKLMSNRDTCNSLVDKLHPVETSEPKYFTNWILYNGKFKSPLAEHLPGSLPKSCEMAHFQLVIPKEWKSADRPVAIHMSGTGDHYFWRRRLLLAKPLLRKGIASLLMENPFYGSRKPEDQIRSNLNHVDNIFLMGGGLILESLAILRWLERNGYGPFCLTGISMGGHMASLAATNWPKPIAVVPCLSWSSASGVFTRGVMSKVVNWEKLNQQLTADDQLKERIGKSLCSFPNEKTDEKPNPNTKPEPVAGGWDDMYKKDVEERRKIVRQKYVFRCMDKLGLVKVIALLNQILSPKDKAQVTLVPGKADKDVDLLTYLDTLEPPFEAIDFMRRLMDHFTHLSNFQTPVDTELVIVVTARVDAYVPRNCSPDIRELWPGSTVRFVDSGHVMAYVKHHKDFEKAIVDAIELYRNKYNLDGTLKCRLGPLLRPEDEPEEKKPKDPDGGKSSQ